MLQQIAVALQVVGEALAIRSPILIPLAGLVEPGGDGGLGVALGIAGNAVMEVVGVTSNRDQAAGHHGAQLGPGEKAIPIQLGVAKGHQA